MTVLIAIMTAATAGLGAAVSGGSADVWYFALEKPGLTPPDFIFAVVWPILFILMAFGAVLVRIKAGNFAACSGALGLYFTQLALLCLPLVSRMKAVFTVVVRITARAMQHLLYVVRHRKTQALLIVHKVVRLVGLTIHH